MPCLHFDPSRHRASWIAGLLATCLVLDLAAASGLAYIAGFHLVRVALAHLDLVWLEAVFGGLVLSFCGYYFAYCEIYRAEGGPNLSTRQMWAIVAAGFGGFLAHGGPTLDRYALKGAGADDREASVRVAALAGFEHGVLAIIGCAAAVLTFLLGRSAPPLDFRLPWAVLPLPGFLLAFWLAGKYRDRLRDRRGIAGKIGIFLESVYLLRHIFTRPREHLRGVVGMAIFWGAEMFAAWSALAVFGERLNRASFVVGFATGAVFTRRTGPLAGAGVLMLVLPLSLWISGAPLSPSVAGFFLFRLVSVWTPVPCSLLSLPTLRELGAAQLSHSQGKAFSRPFEPALVQDPG
jgi:hypothetical protein